MNKTGRKEKERQTGGSGADSREQTDGWLRKAQSDGIMRLKEELERAEAVVIGAGAGLSVSAGYEYSGNRFQEHFRDFEEKYKFHDMYTGGFYPYETPEEYWAYWSRYILINRYMDAPKPVYRELLSLVEDRDYFVITTNVDHCFQRAGFDKKRLFYTQGDFGLWQCSLPCHRETYDNEAAVRQMASRQRAMRIPSELVPRCPVCGRLMSMNLRADNTFVEDGGWREACGRYERYLEEHREKRVLFLELGCGGNTPGIIKYPFWQFAARWPDAFYICVNLTQSCAPREIADRSVCIEADIGSVLRKVQDLEGGERHDA